MNTPIFTKLDKKIKQKALNKVFEGLGIQTPKSKSEFQAQLD
jgi:hypothetical protein